MARGQRFTGQVGFQQQNLGSGFAQGASSVLQKLQQFGRSTDQLIQVQQTQAGIEEAKGETDISKKREAGLGEILLTGGVKTAAYNKSLENAYLAGLSNDTREQIAAIEAENSDNIAQFNDKVEGYLAGALKEVDPSVQDQFIQFADNQITNARIRVHANTVRKNKRIADSESALAIQDFGNEAATLARQGNVTGSAEAIANAFGVIDGMVESESITPDRAAKMKREIERESSEQSLRLKFDGIIEDQGIQGAQTELEKLEGKPAKGWTPDEWQTFTRSVQADINQEAVRFSKQQAAIKAASAREVSNLKIKASTGIDVGTGKQVSPSEIIGETERMFNEGKISGNERSSIITSVIDGQKKAAEDALISQKVAQKLDGNASIALTQKEVDFAWGKDYQGAVQKLPPELQNASIAQFVNDTKIIPKQVNTQIKQNLISDDPDVVSNAADLINRLDSVRGVNDVKLTPNERSFASTVTGLMQNMTSDEAIKLARQNTNPNDSGRVEARKQIIKDEKYKENYMDTVESEFTGFFGADVDQVALGQLTKEYSTLFEQHFIAGMSEGAAEEKAIQLMERNWGETKATTKTRMIKYPPEDFYQVNGSVEYIQEDLWRSVKTANIGLPEFESDDLVLISDETTSREASVGRPSYMVMIDQGEQGLFPLVSFRYTPNFEEQIEKTKTENEKRLEQERGQAITLEEQQEAINRLFQNTRYLN